MGQNAGLILGIAGAVVGGIYGGPAGASAGFSLAGAASGYAIGSTIGSVAFPAKTPNEYRVQGNTSPAKFVSADYGQCIPYIRGSALTAGQDWWHPEDLREIHTWTVSGGGGDKGGGGGGQTFTQTTTFETDILFGLSDNICAGLGRILENGTLIYNALSDADSASVAASAASPHWDRLTFYDGNAAQLPDPTYEAAVGTANAQAYRGRSSVFIQGWKLGQSGQFRNLLFEVIADGTAAGPALATMLQGASASDTYALAGGNSAIVLDGRPLTGKIWVTHLDGAVTYLQLIDLRSGLIIQSIPVLLISNPFVRLSAVDYDNNAIAIDGATLKQVSATTGELRTLSPGLGTITLCAADVDDNIWIVTSGGLYFLSGVNWDAGTASNQLATGFGFTTVSFLFRDPTAIAGRIYFVASSSNCGYVNSTAMTFIDMPTMVAAAGSSFPPLAGSDGQLYKRLPAATIEQYSSEGVLLDSITSASGGAALDIHLLDSEGILWCKGNDASQAAAFDWKLIDTVGMTLQSTLAATYFTLIASELEEGSPAFWGVTAAAGAFGKLGIIEQIGRLTKVNPSYDEVVSDICLRSGMTAGMFDVTDLAVIADDVPSMLWDQISSGRSMLEMLATTGNFEKVESDKIYWRRRGKAVVATIPLNDLGAHTGDDQPEPLALRIANDLEIPAHISLTCPNIDNDYQPLTVMSDRLVSATSETTEAATLALGLTPARAQGVVDTMALDRVARSMAGEIAVLADYSKLECGDRITGTAPDGTTYNLAIVEHTDEFPLMRCRVVVDDASALISEGTTSEDYDSSTVVAAQADTIMRLWDGPIMQDSDNNPGPYVLTKGNTTPYPGAAIFSSTDNVVFGLKTTVNESAIFGIATTALTAWVGGRMVDWKSTVTVNVGAAALTSSTRAAVLASIGVNAMSVGDEIIQFITATLVSVGVYTLTGLLRGGRGTEWAMTGHAIGEAVNLIRPEGIRRIPMENSDIGLVRYYKGVTAGRPISSADSQAFTNMGVGLKPFSPIRGKISRDASNNATLTCQRRTRMTVRLVGPLGVSVPLGEDEENYRVKIYSSSAYATVVHTIEVHGEPTASFTAAEQTAAGLTPGNTIYAKWFMLSGVVNEGYDLAVAA